MIDTPQAAQIALLYRFCAQSMHYPDSSWFNREYRNSLLLLLENLEAKDEQTKLKEVFESDKNLIETLQIEHTRLFINGIPHVAAPPYGSVYINKSLQGTFTEKTLTYYRDNGYVLKENSDLPDHIVHQLEFLSILAEEGNGAAESEFLNTLFLQWFPEFKKRVQKEAQHPFYPVIVQLIDFFTMEENEHGI